VRSPPHLLCSDSRSIEKVQGRAQMALRPSARFYGDEDSEGVGSAPAEEYPNPDPEAYLLVHGARRGWCCHSRLAVIRRASLYHMVWNRAKQAEV
jgi:hypothetical protein